MNLQNKEIINNSIYEEEFIKQIARMEAEEYKKNLEKEKKKMKQRIIKNVKFM